jgi:hypothetical protein
LQLTNECPTEKALLAVKRPHRCEASSALLINRQPVGGCKQWQTAKSDDRATKKAKPPSLQQLQATWWPGVGGAS